MYQVTDALFRADQAGLARLFLIEQRLRKQISQLSTDQARLRDRAIGPPDEARWVGIDERWHAWIAKQQADLNGELSRILVLKSAQIDKVQVSFGRHEAVEKIISDLDKDRSKRNFPK